MRGVRRITTGRRIEGKQHQISHGLATEGIVDSKVTTVAVLRLARHRLACKVAQTTKLVRPRQSHRGTEDLEPKDQGNRTKASSKKTILVVLQDDGRLHAGKAVHLARLVLHGTEGRELIDHLQDMTQVVKSQKKMKNRPNTREALCHQQEP
jgi:hypothetical protein